ncbi:hypothetical protein ACFPM0_19180 [Pseudonocardia sulfidoxydans]|uniref:hypothetical protein n=1 Tax=Pseudonocardia sulfidoxydans TaxID=54011 RepID=UPI003616E1F8
MARETAKMRPSENYALVWRTPGLRRYRLLGPSGREVRTGDRRAGSRIDGRRLLSTRRL